MFLVTAATAPVADHGTLQKWGPAMLGIFIGYMVWYFIVRLGEGKYTTDGLVAIAGVVAGGVVLNFIKQTGTSTRDYWWYTIGLVIGWALFVIFFAINWAVKRISKGKDGAGPVFPTLVPTKTMADAAAPPPPPPPPHQ